MGNSKSSNFVVDDNPDRVVFVTFKAWRTVREQFGVYVVFTYTVRYRRFKWDIEYRYNDMVRLDRVLYPLFGSQIPDNQRPVRFNKLFYTHDQAFLTQRSKMMLKYLQDLLDLQSATAMTHASMKSFLGISAASFNPNMGRKGKEGWLKKCSGGYVEGFSRQMGDYFHVWMWRWIVLHDTCISWYKSPEDTVPRGSMQLDKDFRVTVVGRVLTIVTATRRLLMSASTRRNAEEWAAAIKEFYTDSTRTTDNFFKAAYPPRMNCDVKIYTYTRDYFNSLAIALLSAQKEILITSWKNSPTVLLTRPPYPTLRLDQILKYKADQGVKIFLLLYKEVDYVGQGNDSLRSKTYLESLSPNIRCIRHPNKFIGGSTAVMWSHHEKSVVIDRNLCFLGGVDLAFQRWDDEKHRVADEEGTIFPGQDYRNPAPNLFKPARQPVIRDPNAPPDDDDEIIEVEVALAGENLPQATSTSAAIVGNGEGDDLGTYEVEVVVDFGVSVAEYPALTASNISRAQQGASSAASPQQMQFAQALGPSSSPSADPAPMNLFADSNSTQEGATTASERPPGKSNKRRSTLGLNLRAGDADESDRMSDVSETWAEDRYAPATEEEKQALEAGQGTNVEDGPEDAASDDGETPSSSGRTHPLSSNSNLNSSSTSRASIFNDLRSGLETGIVASKSSIRSSIEFISSQIQTAKEHYNSVVAQKKAGNTLEPREVYPRMPWHDVQASVTGLVARDCASHFVQRWNHHRISASHYSEPVLYDITDNTNYGICARCLTEGLSEAITKCTKCGYDLGPCSSFSTPTDAALCPVPTERYSFIVFECTYPGKLPLPFRMLGDCPVVVTAVLFQSINAAGSRDNLTASNYNMSNNNGNNEGVLIDVQGKQAEWLHAFGLVPAIGDVIVAVDDSVVTQLNSNQLKRLVKRKRTDIRAFLAGRAFVDLDNEPTTRITFRRHFLENLYPVDKAFEGEGAASLKEQQDAAVIATVNAPPAPALVPAPVPAVSPAGAIPTPTSPPVKPPRLDRPFPATAPASAVNHILTEEELQALEDGPVLPLAPNGTLGVPLAPLFDEGESKDGEGNSPAQGSLYSTTSVTPFAPPAAMTYAPETASAVPVVDEELEFGKSGGQGRSSLVMVPASSAAQSVQSADGPVVRAVSAVPLNSAPVQLATATEAPSSNMVIANANKVKQFHPACQAAAQAEVRLSMSTIFHTFYRNIETPSRVWDASGTCKVQLLRSIGKWSTGTKTECSILNCYLETIASSKHLIYIENQFFIGNTAGEGVSNTIPSALVNRILQAHRNKEAFRVVIIIPIHPNGDMAGAQRSKIVMHYEYQTINRGLSSMFAQLRKQAPDISIANYIGFHSLRSWGVINNKVVSDQIYVHDKLMIVDDRVVILGSANINDRSMLGHRDSELAIRIEDTLHVPTTMAGQQFMVGYLPHTVRMQLMRQHLGEDETLDLSDPLNPATRDFWTNRSNTNSAIYDQVDGGISAYRCTTVAQYRDAFANYVNLSYLDPEVKHTMAEIKGFLVDWPQTLFEKEDLSPPLATRMVVSNDLWV